jgi:hypothetical protein
MADRRTARQALTIRPQYHFRPTPDGTLIWNVRRLIELAENLPIVDVALDRIQELDEPYWFEPTGNAPTCRAIATHMKLVADADLQFPVILCAQGRIMDGMHRVVKALNEGRSTIAAKTFTATPAHDFKDIDPGDLPY